MHTPCIHDIHAYIRFRTVDLDSEGRRVEGASESDPFADPREEPREGAGYSVQDDPSAVDAGQPTRIARVEQSAGHTDQDTGHIGQGTGHVEQAALFAKMREEIKCLLRQELRAKNTHFSPPAALPDDPQSERPHTPNAAADPPATADKEGKRSLLDEAGVEGAGCRLAHVSPQLVE